MRKTLILPAALLVATAVVAGAQTAKPAAQPAAPAPSGQPQSVEDRASYIIGYNLGRTFKQNDVKANMDLIMKGLREGLAGDKAMLTDAEMQSTMQTFQQQVMAAQQAKQKVMGEKNKAEGEAFLAKNKSRPGVKTTASGLQYEVEKEGTGANPKPTDTVTVNYKGTLMDGTVFDSSYDRGQPATFVLNQVIPGWTEGVQLMKPGAKYKFYIPSSLGYGEQGAGAAIGPNSPLIFEVELLSVGKPEEPAKPGAATPGQPAEKPMTTDQKPPAR